MDFSHEHLPQSIPFQGVFQQACRLVLDVVQPCRAWMLLAKTGDAAMQVRPAVAHDCPWNSRLGGRRLELPKNHLPVRLGHRHQVDQFHVLLAEDPVVGVPVRLAQPDEDQAFPLAQLHRVVYDPYPIVGLDFGAAELVQPQSQQPQPRRIVTGDSYVEVAPAPVHRQHGRYAPQSRARAEHQRQGARHHAQRELVPGQRTVQVIWPQQCQVARADIGGHRSRAWCVFLSSPRQASFPPGDLSAGLALRLSSDYGFWSSPPSGTSGSCSPVWPPCTWPSTCRGSDRRIEATWKSDSETAVIDGSTLDHLHAMSKKPDKATRPHQKTNNNGTQIAKTH